MLVMPLKLEFKFVSSDERTADAEYCSEYTRLIFWTWSMVSGQKIHTISETGSVPVFRWKGEWENLPDWVATGVSYLVYMCINY
jgi:hypothetical protein